MHACSLVALSLCTPCQGFLDKVDAGAKKWLGGARDECWARQWRTRMFECLAAHQVGSPQSERALTWLREVKAHFESSPSNEATWTAYLDNLQNKLGEKEITLDLLQKGPANLGKDEVVAQCVLPFLNNAFPYVPLSLKLSNFLKMGIYDPSEGRIFGANLRKLALQYHQYVFDEVDYKAGCASSVQAARHMCRISGCDGRARATRQATTEKRAVGSHLSFLSIEVKPTLGSA